MLIRFTLSETSTRKSSLPERSGKAVTRGWKLRCGHRSVGPLLLTQRSWKRTCSHRLKLKMFKVWWQYGSTTANTICVSLWQWTFSPPRLEHCPTKRGAMYCSKFVIPSFGSSLVSTQHNWGATQVGEMLSPQPAWCWWGRACSVAILREEYGSHSSSSALGNVL